MIRNVDTGFRLATNANALRRDLAQQARTTGRPRSERQGHAFARRSRARLRGCDVEGRRRQPGPRHGDRRGQGRPGDADDDGPAAHGQRPAHRPWRLHLHAGGFRLRLCLQLATTSAPSRRRATSPSSGRASSAIGWSRPRARSRAAGAPASTMCASPWAMHGDRRVSRSFPHHRRHMAAGAETDTKQK